MLLLLVSSGISGCSDTETDAARYAAQAEILLDQNRFAEARQTITKAIATRDDVAEYHLLRGRIEYSAGAFENAYSAYSEALALAPSNQEALQAVSQIGIRVGRLNESLDATDKLLVLNPNFTDALLIRGLHALIKRDFESATRTADQILSIDRLNEGGVVLKARASFLSGNPQEAAHILDVFDSTRPNTPAVSLTRLEIYRSLRNPEMMAQQYSALGKLRPDDLALKLDHANFLYKTGNDANATRSVSSVLAHKDASPQNVDGAIQLWREYAVTKIDSGLIKSIKVSGTPAARISAARYFIDIGNISVASALLAGITGADAEAESANIAVAQGDFTRARKLVSGILDADKTHCSALGTRANLLYASRRYADALRSAQSASSECPQQPRLWQLTAKIYAAMGEDANVRRVFGQGIDANKQSEVLSRAYSEYLLEQQSPREAIAVARKLTRSAPALNSGWRLYAEICARTRSTCLADAQQGLADSRTRYGVDLLPGEAPPNGLFGRLVVR
ncbi:tetratricopeptide repeat protein [Sphingorhabdus sp.]|uniref:tetratricopeptide repeat protein n=1 Tax=Sphingorhabdus sp. TaxID=1902408 RepID=UPI00391AC06E